MNIKIIAMITAVFVFPCLVFADEFRQGLFFQLGNSVDSQTWVEFELYSDNAAYTAEIKALGGQQDIPAKKRTYTVIVSKIINGIKQEFWRSSYEYDGYPTGILADDGSTFVYVSKYYNDKPMVKIYRLGSRTAFLYSSSFNINPASFKTGKNGKLWLDQDSRGYQFVYRGRMPPLLEITTIDKTKYYISLESGEILPD